MKEAFLTNTYNLRYFSRMWKIHVMYIPVNHTFYDINWACQDNESYLMILRVLQSKLSSLGTGGKSVDVCPLVSRATLDTMLRCALSYVNDEVQSTER